MEFNNRAHAENLIETMKYYLPGDREERREMTSRLLTVLLEEKALAMLRKRFGLCSYIHLGRMIDDLEALPSAWKEEGLNEIAETQGKKREAGLKSYRTRVENEKKGKGKQPSAPLAEDKDSGAGRGGEEKA